MSKLTPKRLRCAVCTAWSEQLVAESAESFEPPDFDTRPGKPSRSGIAYWVQACPDCGYCANDISVSDEGVPEYVRHSIYRAFRNNKVFPEKATQFLCYALVLEKSEQFADAGWTALHAAWICDDAKDIANAASCRRRAIELWKQAKAVGQAFMDNDFEEFGLVADVHRRVEEWDEARAAAQGGLECEGIPQIVNALLRRELAFVDRKDSTAHNMAELRAAKPGGAR